MKINISLSNISNTLTYINRFIKQHDNNKEKTFKKSNIKIKYKLKNHFKNKNNLK